VNVHDFGKFSGNIAQLLLEFRLPNNLFSRFDGRRLAFDVSEDGHDFGDFTAHLGLEAADFVVGLLHAELLVEFEMLLDMQVAVEILHTDVVDIEIVTGSDGANAVKNIFGATSARNGVDHDIGVGKNFTHLGADGIGDLLGALEGEVALESDGDIGEIAVTGFTEADAFDFKDAIDGADAVLDQAAHADRRGIEQGVHGTSGQAPTDGDDDAGDEQSSDGIRLAKPVDVIEAPDGNEGEADDDDATRPDVGRKVESVGFEGLAVVLEGDASERAGAPGIDDDGERHDEEGGEAGFDFDAVKKEALDGFGDDPDTGEKEQSGFDEGGEIFEFAVSVLMVGVGGLVGNADGEKRYEGGDEI